jgi:hypothetical protein
MNFLLAFVSRAVPFLYTRILRKGSEFPILVSMMNCRVDLKLFICERNYLVFFVMRSRDKRVIHLPETHGRFIGR